jgi:hypothetical protein
MVREGEGRREKGEWGQGGSEKGEWKEREDGTPRLKDKQL